MKSSCSLRAFAIAAIALVGISCSSKTSSEGGGDSAQGTGAAFSIGSGGVFGSGGVIGIGASGNGSGGIAGGGTGVSGNGAFGGSGNGGSAGGAAGNAGSSSGGVDGVGGGSSANGGSGSGGIAGVGGTGGTAPRTDGGSLVGSTGCGKTPTVTFGMVPGEDANAAPGSGSGVGTGDGGYVTIQSSGQSRSFAMRLPANYDKNHPYWLIFGFHWNGGNSAQVDNGGTNGYWWSYFGLQRESNNGAIFVAPQGINAGWANSGGQDLTFTDDMVKLIEEDFCVDTTHIITSGFSYGGGMSYEIACARAKSFRAAVIYEGGQLSGCDGGNDPIALWQTEGLTDTTVNMSFATPIRDRFVKNNGCTPQDPPQPPQPPPYLNPGGHVCTDYSGCSVGHPVRWCVSQSGHGPGPIDGNSDLYNSCATPPKTCSTTCPCTWTPDDVWSWLTSF